MHTGQPSSSYAAAHTVPQLSPLHDAVDFASPKKKSCIKHGSPLQKPSLTHCKSWEQHSECRQSLLFPSNPCSLPTLPTPPASALPSPPCSFPSPFPLSPSSPNLTHPHFHTSPSPGPAGSSREQGSHSPQDMLRNRPGHC